jgi:predicted double-glycine peptidase
MRVVCLVASLTVLTLAAGRVEAAPRVTRSLRHPAPPRGAHTRSAPSRPRSSMRLARRTVLAVPLVPQTTDHTCGPAALASVLRYFGVQNAADESLLARALGTTAALGTEPQDLARVAEHHGVRAEYRERMTLSELAQQVRLGKPVLVLYQAWSERPGESYATSYASGHYGVVVGVDHRYVYVADPWVRGARTFIPRGEFVERWHGRDRGRPVAQVGITMWREASSNPPLPIGRLIRTL